MADWLRENGGALALSVHVQPGTKRSEVAGLHGDALKVRLSAPAIDGRANAALVDFVAQRLGVAKSLIELKSGQRSRRKVLAVRGVALDDARRLLGQ
ncbi:MAG: YggU family protein [Candidatus Accumulibacter sp.]|nr:YggU family protein [Accumulibacter sp.]